MGWVDRAFGRLPVTPLLFSFDLTFCTFTLQFNSRQTHDMLSTRTCSASGLPPPLPCPAPSSATAACIFVHFHVGNFIWFGSLWEFKLKCAFSFCFSLLLYVLFLPLVLSLPLSPRIPLQCLVSCVDKIVCCKSARNST